MTTIVMADYTLPAGQEVTGVNEDAFLSQGPDWNAITINGRIAVTDVSKGVVFGARLGAANLVNGTFSGVHTFTVGTSGVISVTTTVNGGFAGGLAGYDTVRIVNLGAIDIHSAAEGLGVGASRAGFDNRGTITYEGARSGTGVTLDQGGSFANSGTISVTAGSNAEGFAVGVRLSQSADSFTFQNSGTIRAIPLNAASSTFGVVLSGYVNVVNSGLIEAGRALVFNRDGISSGGGRHADITNTGTIRGEVFLNNTAAEPVHLLNSGLIEGSVTLNTGSDTYSGVGGRVTGPVHGEAGADSIVGGAGSETLSGDAGNDTVDGGAGGADILDGGEGIDTLSFGGAAAGIVLDVTGQTATLVTFRGFEQYLGSEHADRIAGSAAADTLGGGGGADTVSGGASNDSITDTGGANYLRGDEGDDVIRGGADFDDINGNTGADTASGGAGEDWVVGGKDNDSLSGDGAYDLVYGNLGNDTCDGGAGNDIVRGGQDDDVVRGGDGDDYVSGDRGSDTMTGGAGADIFHTFGDAGFDRVEDFNLLQGDRVQIDPGTTYTIAQVANGTMISMSGGGQMLLVGVSMSSLPDGWIFGA